MKKEIISYREYDIEIGHDSDIESPREWDNLGKMVCFHNRYSIGDKHNYSIEDVKKIAKSNDYISLPIYAYIHSGITINTHGFSCPWDSGQVGFIFVSREYIRKEYSVKRITKKTLETVYSVLESEVKTYDQYLTGDIYYYVISKNDETIYSCCGFYGEEYCIQEAKDIVDFEVESRIKEHAKKVKTYITNNVPLEKRQSLQI